MHQWVVQCEYKGASGFLGATIVLLRLLGEFIIDSSEKQVCLKRLRMARRCMKWGSGVFLKTFRSGEIFEIIYTCSPMFKKNIAWL